MDGVALVLTDAPDGDDVALVERGLMAFNVERSIPYDRRPLCVFVRDGAGRAVGGATGYTNWGWLYLDCLWLPDGLRRGGWGRRVLAAAEAEAVERGCRRARLFTYSFQARGFYERNGYAAFGVLEDYPPGHRQIWMRKDLAADEKAGPAGTVNHL